MRKIKTGDEVILIAGKDKGKRGKVIRVTSDGQRVVVENANLAKRHTKGDPRSGSESAIVNKEMPLAISNVALFNPVANKADRVGFKILEDGRKVRYFKSDGEIVDL